MKIEVESLYKTQQQTNFSKLWYSFKPSVKASTLLKFAYLFKLCIIIVITFPYNQIPNARKF